MMKMMVMTLLQCLFRMLTCVSKKQWGDWRAPSDAVADVWLEELRTHLPEGTLPSG